MAIKDADLIVVRNRNNGTTGYSLDNNFHRTFNVNETKKVPFSELQALINAPGGEYILNNYLVVENAEALELLNMKVQPEYFYTEEKVKEILFRGSYDEFADFLDFAPNGAIEIAKQIAVKEEIPDNKKREMLSEKTGLNINSAIIVNKVMDSEDNAEKEAPKQRRVQIQEDTPAAEQKPTRRAATPNYKVVSK
jgi:hypothetical protein